MVAFADLFDDIEVFIYSKDKHENAIEEYGQPIGKIKVPVILAPKEKVVSLLNEHAGDRPEVDNKLPKISIIMSGIKPDPARWAGQKQQRDLMSEYANNSSTGKPEMNKHYDMKSVAYTIDMEVTVWAKYMDQGIQILENILPFFHPEAYISVIERGLGAERKSKVTLNSVTPNFVYELNEPDRRVIQFVLSFSMEVNLYKPMYVDKPIHNVFINVSVLDTKNPRKAQGETIVVSASGANFFGVDPLLMDRIQDLDQITPSVGTITASNKIISINSWANNSVEIIETLDAPAPYSADLHPGEINDEHNPPTKYEYPVARYTAYKYYNELNRDAYVVPDPAAKEEYDAWIASLEEEQNNE